MVGIGVICAHVIELRNGQVHLMPPAISAVLAAPQTAIVSSNDQTRILRIDPHIVEVAMGSAGNSAKALSSIGAQEKRSIWLEDLVLVFGIDDQVAEVKWAPHHEVAAVEFGPARARVIGAI